MKNCLLRLMILVSFFVYSHIIPGVLFLSFRVGVNQTVFMQKNLVDI